jgi:BTB/POZ domain
MAEYQQHEWKNHWTLHAAHLATAAQNCWTDKSLADITLECEGQTIPSHKFMLAAFSPLLKELLTKVIARGTKLIYVPIL